MLLIISQLGWLFPIYGKNVRNHQPDYIWGFPMKKKWGRQQSLGFGIHDRPYEPATCDGGLAGKALYYPAKCWPLHFLKLVAALAHLGSSSRICLRFFQTVVVTIPPNHQQQLNMAIKTLLLKQISVWFKIGYPQKWIVSTQNRLHCI